MYREQFKAMRSDARRSNMSLQMDTASGMFGVSRYGVEPINRNWTFRRSATENHAQALRMAAYARLRGILPACRELVALAKSYRIHG